MCHRSPTRTLTSSPVRRAAGLLELDDDVVGAVTGRLLDEDVVPDEGVDDVLELGDRARLRDELCEWPGTRGAARRGPSCAASGPGPAALAALDLGRDEDADPRPTRGPT